MTNPSTTKSIRVDQLGIEGYVLIMDGNAESHLLDRPVISLPTNATPPTFTKPVVILPGKSITAYIEDKSFVVDFYAAYACYFVENDSIDPSTTKLQANNHFCFHVKQQD